MAIAFTRVEMQMKKIGIVLLAAVALAAQAQALKERGAVAVTVSGDQIDDPGDIHTAADEGALVWVIGSRGYRFADAKGIAVQSGGKHACRTLQDGQRVRCTKAGHRRGERFKYEINLIDANGRAMNLDPFIVND